MSDANIDKLTKPMENYNELFKEGDLLYWKCEYEKAKEHFQLVLNQPPSSLMELARCYNSIGAANTELKQYEEALCNYQERLSKLLELIITGKGEMIVKCYMSIGKVYWLKQDYVRAIDYHKKALDAFSTDIPMPDLTANVYKNLANLYTKTNEYDTALSYFEKALAIDLQHLNESHPKFGQTYANIGAMYNSKEDYHRALEYFKKACETWRKSLPPSHVYIESMEKTICQVQSKLGSVDINTAIGTSNDQDIDENLREQDKSKDGPDDSTTQLRSSSSKTKQRRWSREASIMENSNSRSFHHRLAWIGRLYIFFILGLTCTGIIYRIYVAIVCSSACTLPFVCRLCPIDESSLISLPPLSTIGEKTASLAERLIDADVSARVRLMRTEKALIKIRAKIIDSDIDPTDKREWRTRLDELNRLTHQGAEQFSVMSNSFPSALDNMQTSIKLLLEQLSKIANEKKQDQHRPIGTSDPDKENALEESFGNVISSANQQVETILERTKTAHTTLEEMEEKLETLSDLMLEGELLSTPRLSKPKHGSFSSNLFYGGIIRIAQYKRNLLRLGSSGTFLNIALGSVREVIRKLQKFEHEAQDLQKTAAALNHLPRLLVGIQTKLLKVAIRRLGHSKDIFMEKKQKVERSEARDDTGDERGRTEL